MLGLVFGDCCSQPRIPGLLNDHRIIRAFFRINIKNYGIGNALADYLLAGELKVFRVKVGPALGAENNDQGNEAQNSYTNKVPCPFPILSGGLNCLARFHLLAMTM